MEAAAQDKGIQMTLFEYFADADQFSLDDAKECVYQYAEKQVKEPSIRARIYEGINKGLFKRLGKGVYTVTKKNAEDEDITCMLIQGDGRDISFIADNSIDAIITDHPYLLKNSLKGGNRDFASYDLFQYTQEDLDEKFRVLKKGHFLVEFLPEENGDNYEYLYQVKAMAKSGIGSTIKHFCGNNQEVGRSTSDSVISERALREIYLKGFEIAVKEGGARSVMTTYGSVNGLWTAGSYDLCTTILRKEWGFQGIVMTDWWAKSNYEGHQAEVTAKAPMVAAQNDIYMVVSDAKSNPENDDVEEMLHAGKITVGELQRNAANILGFLLKSPSVLLLTDRICKEELEAMNTKEEDDVDAGSLVSIESDSVTQKIVIDGALLHPAKGKADVIAVTNEFMGDFTMKFTLKSDLGELAQLPVSVFLDNIHKMTVSVQGTNGKWVEESRILNMGFGHNHYIKFYYGADNLEIKEIVLTPNR